MWTCGCTCKLQILSAELTRRSCAGSFRPTTSPSNHSDIKKNETKQCATSVMLKRERKAVIANYSEKLCSPSAVNWYCLEMKCSQAGKQHEKIKKDKSGYVLQSTTLEELQEREETHSLIPCQSHFSPAITKPRWHQHSFINIGVLSAEIARTLCSFWIQKQLNQSR